MNEGKAMALVAFILLFTFLAFLYPQIANNAFASTSTSYARPLLVGMVTILIGVVAYLAATKVIDHG